MKWVWILVGGAFVLVVGFVVVVNLGYIQLGGSVRSDREARPTPDEQWAEWERQAEELLAEFEEAAPAYTQEQAEAWVDELMPLIESCAGRSFLERPRIETVDRQMLTETLASQILTQYIQLVPGLDDEETMEIARMEASAYATSMLGLYDPLTGAVYLAPTNVEPAMRWVGADTDDLEPVVRLVIAHELTHALHHQHLDVSAQREAAFDGVAAEAIEATSEGYATFLAERVAERLGLDAAMIDFAATVAAGAAPSKYELYGKTRRYTELTYERRYLGGRDFFRHHYAEGGPERLWEILADPPKSMSVILQPRTYGEPLTRRDYSAVLAGLERHFALDPGDTLQPAARADGLISDFQSLAADVQIDAATYIEAAHHYAYRFDGRSGYGSLWLVVVTSRDFASRLAELAEERVMRQLERRRLSEIVKVRNERIGDLTGIAADVARTISYGVEIPGQWTTPWIWAVICRDTVFVEITVRHRAFEDDELTELAEEVFRRLESAPLMDETGQN